MSQKAAASKGIIPLARIVAVAQIGVEPEIMGIGPVEAVKLVVSTTLLIVDQWHIVNLEITYR